MKQFLAIAAFLCLCLAYTVRAQNCDASLVTTCATTFATAISGLDVSKVDKVCPPFVIFGTCLDNLATTCNATLGASIDATRAQQAAIATTCKDYKSGSWSLHSGGLFVTMATFVISRYV